MNAVSLRPEPGDALLHPAALAGVALLVANDHLLKRLAPSVLTGKLSDFAGIVFFPLVLVGIWEVGAAIVRRWRGPRLGTLLAATSLTTVAFVAVKTTLAGALAFGWLIGTLQWAAAVALSWITAGPLPHHGVVPVVADPTDLVALAALAAPLMIGLARLRAPSMLPLEVTS